jgi:hypothetical protein
MYDISYAAAGGSFEREQEDSLNKKIPHRWEERQGIRSYVRLLFIERANQHIELFCILPRVKSYPCWNMKDSNFAIFYFA